MKTIRTKNNALGILAMVSSLAFATGGNLGRAQETVAAVQSAAPDSIVQLTAEAQGLAPAPPGTLPRWGTFWLVTPGPGGAIIAPLPCPPLNPYLPVYAIAPGQFLVDGTGGKVILSSRLAANSTVNSALEAQAGAVVNLIQQVENATNGGLIPPGGGVALAEPLTRPVYTTNDLWLEMAGMSNSTAFLTIHEPWTVTNGVYDLYYTTNLSAPASWSWLMRSFAGVTNLAVNNATNAQGYYRLGPLNDPMGNDSLGTNFWLAFFSMDPTEESLTNRQARLYISSPVGASGTVTFPQLGITNTFTVAAGAVTNVSLPANAVLRSYWFMEVESNGIHVVSSQPVSVYGLFYSPFASAAFTGYPTTLLGTNYCLLARPAITYDGDSQGAVVATEDNTTLNVYACATADLFDKNDNPITNFSLTLQAGQVFQFTSADAGATDPLYLHNDDVTGTWIESDKPVAVFAGASQGLVPDANTQAANPLVQQQLPVEDWGTQALGLSFAGRTNGATYRVLAAYSNTVVSVTGAVVIITNEPGPGPWQVFETNETVVVTNQAGMPFDIIVDGPVEFQASQPIQVAQFANGAASDNPTIGEGDPCEILLPPIGHYLETNIVFTLTNDLPNQVTGDFSENFLNLIVSESATTNTWVDGSLVEPTNFVPIGASSYCGAQITVTNGTHTVISSRPVGVEIYGFGNWDAYGYLGGIVK
jgi:IgGFc binding protein